VHDGPANDTSDAKQKMLSTTRQVDPLEGSRAISHPAFSAKAFAQSPNLGYALIRVWHALQPRCARTMHFAL
jgi:hypothetical protein